MNELIYFFKTRKKANLTIVIINVVVYIVLALTGDPADSAFMLRHGACYLPSVINGEYYRLFTSMFLHFGFYHIAYNMLSLIFLGDILETIAGPARYLIIYLVGGIGGNLLSLAVSMRTGSYAVSAGASGAIFSVIRDLLRHRSTALHRPAKQRYFRRAEHEEAGLHGRPDDHAGDG